jgi:hypothetical protein
MKNYLWESALLFTGVKLEKKQWTKALCQAFSFLVLSATSKQLNIHFLP